MGNEADPLPRLLLHSDRPQIFESAIRAQFPKIEISRCQTYSEIVGSLRVARPDVVLSHKFEARPYPGQALVEAESVRWVHVGGTGVDHFRPWRRDRIRITNSAGAPRVAIAEYVIGAIYALNHRLNEYLRAQARQQWVTYRIRVAEGGTIAVVGLGRIGRSICSKAKAAGLRVLGIRAHPEAVPDVDEVFTPDRMKIALGQADYVAVAVPLTEHTSALLHGDAIAAIKPGAILINVSRGGVVDEPSLIEALRSGHLRGAVVDVFLKEPLPSDSPLWHLDNVIVTPHIAGFFEGWEMATISIFCENLVRWIAKEPLLNEVDPDVGY
jgi:phosphoglycerate dehydrogenase-like enzyme